jgi:Asp-tRNA(Asn)/Glu-tRNA(Gln) amidotransferase A subunit family amidase
METTIDDIHAAMKAGKLTAHQLVQDYLDRIDAYNEKGPAINCVINVNPVALAEADRLDAEFKKSGFVGPLHGIPILVKDQVDAVPMADTLGSVVFKDYYPPLDATVVAKLKAAGAIILGKATLGEFGGGDAYGSLFGATRNPYDLTRTSGGSSGGSGACVSANFSTITLGEEGFASVRRPGAWNSVVSMRPSPGLTSRVGLSAGYPSKTGQLAPMARNVHDLAVMLDSMVGYDEGDPLTSLGYGHIPKGSYTQFLDKNGLKGARIGILRQSMGRGSEPGSADYAKVTAVFDKAVAELKAAGAVVIDPIVVPDLNKLMDTRTSEPGEGDKSMENWLARNPDSRYKTAAEVRSAPGIEKFIPPTRSPANYKPPTAEDWKKYGEFLVAREQLELNIKKVIADNKLDAIVFKTVEHSPTLIKDGMNPPYTNEKGATSLNTFLIYAASMTVPAGFTTDNLPVGITFFNFSFTEPKLLKYAYSYEQATHHRIPPKTTPALGARETATDRTPGTGVSGGS